MPLLSSRYLRRMGPVRIWKKPETQKPDSNRPCFKVSLKQVAGPRCRLSRSQTDPLAKADASSQCRLCVGLIPGALPPTGAHTPFSIFNWFLYFFELRSTHVGGVFVRILKGPELQPCTKCKQNKRKVLTTLKYCFSKCRIYEYSDGFELFLKFVQGMISSASKISQITNFDGSQNHQKKRMRNSTYWPYDRRFIFIAIGFNYFAKPFHCLYFAINSRSKFNTSLPRRIFKKSSYGSTAVWHSRDDFSMSHTMDPRSLNKIWQKKPETQKPDSNPSYLKVTLK